MRADLRLLPAAVTAWLAAGLTIATPDVATPAALVGWLLTGALAAVALAAPAGARRRHWTAAAALAALAAALACTVVAVAAPARQPAALVGAAEASRFVTATVVVEQTAREGGRYTATMTAFTIGDERHTVSVPVLVFDGVPEAGAGIGTVIQLDGTLRATAAEDDVAFLFFAAGDVAVVGDPTWLLDGTNRLRAGFAALATELPGEGGNLLPGLAIGDTGAVSEQLDADMKTTALSHLTAVSGANCAVVIGIVMLCGGRMGLSRGWRIAASLTLLSGFVVLVTPEPSVVRAAVMAAVVLLALASGRPVRGIPVLSVAVLVLVVSDPWLSRSYGFVLSVLATGGLLLLAGPLARRLARFLPSTLAVVIAVPLAAQLACQPVLVLLSPRIPVYGVVANLLAEPAAPVATVIGLLACLALPVVPWLGALLAHLAWLPSAWIAAISGFFASAPGASLPWPGGAPGLGLLVVITVAGLVAVMARTGGRPRLLAASVAVVVLVGYAGAALGTQLTRQLSMPADWQIAACDVGQGDAVVVRSAGEVALIDTGPEAALLATCLEQLGIGRVDLLVLSHFDLDHVGGTDAVLGRVDRVLAGPTDGVAGEQVLSALAEHGAIIESASRGVNGLLGEFRWSVLWPQERLGHIQPGNDASVAMTFLPVGDCAAGCLSSLFLGDLGEHAQASMLAAQPVPVVDVVKVSHHGSADQSARLYERAAATVGVIGVGASNTYGHPNELLLAMLDGAGTAVTRTDAQGLVLLAPARGGGVELWTER